MARSNYDYAFKTYKGRNFLVIEDLNRGAMSVTNNMETVVDECFNDKKLEPHQVYIIYQDSDGMWDGWDAAKQDFVVLHQHTEEDAKDAIIRMYENLS